MVRIQSSRSSHSLLMGMKNVFHFGKVWYFLTKLNLVLPYDIAVVFLGVYYENLGPHKNLHKHKCF